MLKDLIRRWSRDLFVEPLLLALVIFSPLVYGSVTNLPLSILEAASCLLFFLVIIRALINKTVFFFKIKALFFAGLFACLVLFQLFPLPAGLFSFTSPATLELYKIFSANNHYSRILSICPEATMNLFLQFLSFLLVFFAVLEYLDTEKKARRVIITMIIAAFLYSLYGIINKGFSSGLAGFSTFTNPAHFAAYLEIIIFLGLGCIFLDSSKTSRVVFIFMVSVMLTALFLTSSRAGRISVSLSALLFLLLLGIKKPLMGKLPLVFILVLLVCLFAFLIGFNQIMYRMDTLKDPQAAYAIRSEFLKDSLKVIRDFPIFGTGFGTFGEIAQKYKTSNWQFSYVFMHNEPLQLAAETGIIGFLLILLSGVFFLKEVLSLWIKRRSAFALSITAGGIAGLFSVFFHSLFDFVFHTPAVSLLFFISLALILRAAYMKEKQDLLLFPRREYLVPAYMRRPLITMAIILLIFVEYGVIWKRYQAESIFEKLKEARLLSSQAQGAISFKQALREIDKAIALNPFNSLYFNKKADLLADLGASTDDQEPLLAAERFYKKAINLNPARADFHIRLGWLYRTLGDDILSRKQFDLGLLLDPQNESIKSYLKGAD